VMTLSWSYSRTHRWWWSTAHAPSSPSSSSGRWRSSRVQAPWRTSSRFLRGAPSTPSSMNQNWSHSRQTTCQCTTSSQCRQTSHTQQLNRTRY
jgi:hypothetical protein